MTLNALACLYFCHLFMASHLATPLRRRKPAFINNILKLIIFIAPNTNITTSQHGWQLINVAQRRQETVTNQNVTARSLELSVHLRGGTADRRRGTNLLGLLHGCFPVGDLGFPRVREPRGRAHPLCRHTLAHLRPMQ